MQEPAGGRAQSQWDTYADQLREKLPAAPEGLLAGYVTWAPWVAIVFGALGILGALTLLGIGSALPFMMTPGSYYAGALVVGLIAGAASALELVGGILMRQMRLMGWWLLALGLILGVLNNLFSAGIVGLVVTLAIAYVHLQVKPRYH